MRPPAVLDGKGFSQARRKLRAVKSNNQHRRQYSYSASASAATSTPVPARRFSINAVARQKEDDREFYIDVLGATATKREAKSYLSRFKPAEPGSKPAKKTTSRTRDSGVNLGNLYVPVRSIEDSPVFSQIGDQRPFTDPKTQPLRTALVLLKGLETDVDDETLADVGKTLFQLSRLGLSPIVVVDNLSDGSQDANSRSCRTAAAKQADRVVAAIEKTRGAQSRRLDGILDMSAIDDSIKSSVEVRGEATVSRRNHLLKPLYRGDIPVVASLAFDTTLQKVVPVSSRHVMLALTRDLAGLSYVLDLVGEPPHEPKQRSISLDRIIILDPHGGIAATSRVNGSHVFINLDQEYESILGELSKMDTEATSPALRSDSFNLKLARDTLMLLPPSSSAFITTPAAASATRNKQPDLVASAPGVGTRTQRNALIHNLLTDKPVFSSSLPLNRLVPDPNTSSISPVDPQPPTFIKRGMPITIFPDPKVTPWVPPSGSKPTFSLSDPSLDLPRLIHLIEDSFGRKLDAKAYFERIAPRLAGIIVAGAYEGGAILTWETPPRLRPKPDSNGSVKALATEPSGLVPYLDKFAVLQRSQGSGGVADIVFNTMTRTCFPYGVAWRSRSLNPVNKWYFERAKGSWKIPVPKGEQGWTMFWTTESVEGKLFSDYEGVCKGIGTNWADGKKRLD